MTRNEKIAEVMGWEFDINLNRFYLQDRMTCIGDGTKIEFAKLLQDRMVADGWNITNLQWGIDKFCAWAEKSNDLRHSPDCISEPAALHDLFCKVFSIEGEA